MTNPEALDRRTPLHGELQWLVRLRWFAGITVAFAALASALASGWSGLQARGLVLGLVILAYNVPLWLIIRNGAGGEPERPFGPALAWIQILLDLLCLTLVTTWTGGLDSPVLGFYVLHLVFAGLLLPPLASYGCVIASMAMLFTALWVADQWPVERSAFQVAVGWSVTLLFTALLTDHVARTIRDRASETLRQSRRLKAILDTAAEGIVTIDDVGVILTVNAAAERIFGYTPAELKGQNISILTPEPHRSAHDGYIDEYKRTGVSRIIGLGREVCGQRKDGTEIPLEVAVSEVRFGAQRFFTGIVRDITERRQAEEELHDLNHKLLRQQQALVQHEKMAALGQMAAGVAHEIANPLASMDSLLQLIRRQPDRLRADTPEVLQQQLERINRIIQQMTEFAHPNETAWETIPLNTVVAGALDMVRFDQRIDRVEVVRELSPTVYGVRVMPHAIQQVVINLVMNAMDALADARDPRLRVATRREGEWSVIEVADNGHGIAPEDIGHIFEPFFTTKSVGQGTGLGLSISYSLVERHGGHLQVESPAGSGACFSVYLPEDGEGLGRGKADPEDIPDSGT
ncbi:MAG: PAS domain S-box protein [Planctomycetes bacterium]|nr:PAS domain S-box protein [Planctomycetota bacterium]